MNCQQVQLAMADRSVGLLEPNALRKYDAHVAACPACAAEARRFERCVTLLDHAARPRPSADLWSAIHVRLELERSISSYAPGVPVMRPSRPVWTGAAAAFAGFASAMVLLLNLGTHPVSTGPALASAPPAVSTSLRNGVDNDSPVADVASTVAVDAATVRPMPALSVALARFAPDRVAQSSFIPTGGAVR